ncbi:DUF1501 domain-containing protein [Thalassoglobus sp. JC818]|uniref:DUF1501 domain-containing protein n=1 Tax=Thalassoglobus sp. JC818 TaxID=3232136 RepID=UPI0034574CDD
MHPSYLPTPEPFFSRREALLRSGTGFGALALASMLPTSSLKAGPALTSHIQPRAKSIIFLFMEGGPSHLDLFDPKPQLNKLAGSQLPAGYKKVITAMGEANSPLLGSQRKWKQHGESGIWTSDWIPHISSCVDDIAVIRSCWTNGINHSGGVCQMNTGTPLPGRPSLGSWVSYGLGTENQNLPGFVVMTDNPSQVTNGPRNWSAGFMPASYQGTKLDSGMEPIANLNNPKGISDRRQRMKLDLLNDMNTQHAARRESQTELEARIQSYELAFRMQANAPEAIDLESETNETQKLYGIDEKQTEAFGRNCLLARRLVEQGVRFIQLYHGAGSKWDAHSAIENNHTRMCRQMDKPVAGLIHDLKRRGLLDETLVLWGGEFGRTPMSEKGDGRDHNPTGFTMFMAGGGVAGGQTIGATDDLGFHAVENRLHVHDLHATILYLMGIDHMALTYLHKGRPERPTQNEGDAYRLITGRTQA